MSVLRSYNPKSFTHCRDGGVTPTNVESYADIDWCDEIDKHPHLSIGYDWHSLYGLVPSANPSD